MNVGDEKGNEFSLFCMCFMCKIITLGDSALS